MTAYTRVTLAGTRRRVDVVVPSDEPVGRLLPDVIRLTGEAATAPPSMRHLAAVDGTLLDPDATLAEAGVPDGALLRLVGLADAPPPPVVHDVVEETAEDLDRRRWRWGTGPKHALGTVALALGGLLTVHLLAGALDGAARTALLVAVPTLAVLLGASLGRSVPAPIGLALLATGATTAGYAVLALADGAMPAAIGLALVGAVCTVGLGLGTALGRGALVGGATGLTLAGCWWAALAAGTAPALVAAGATVVSVFLLGLLPRLALITSGLTGLDDRRSHDAEVSRRDVATALTDAHRGLSLAAVAVATSAGAAGWLLGVRPTVWTATLAALLIVVLVLRARSFPLVGPVVTLAAAAGATVLGLALGPMTWPVGVAVGLGAVAVFAGLVAEPPEHVRARIRRSADRLETVAVVVSVPVALGVSGVYGHLLAAF